MKDYYEQGKIPLFIIGQILSVIAIILALISFIRTHASNDESTRRADQIQVIQLEKDANGNCWKIIEGQDKLPLDCKVLDDENFKRR